MRAFSRPDPKPAPVTMAVIGDSLAFGLGASTSERGLAYLMFSRVREERPGSTYSNFGVPHSTMGDVLRHQVPQLRRVNPTLVLVIAGANDLRFTRDGSVIARRYRKLLESVHESVPGACVVTAGMPDVTQTIAVPAVLKPAASRLCRRINDLMRRVANELGDDFIDLFAFTNAPLQRGINYMCSDGYHPHDGGHAEIAERAYPVVRDAIERCTQEDAAAG